MTLTIPTVWQSYTALRHPHEHTVRGDLLVQSAVYSPHLNNERDILVWLPDSYERSARRYPVIYMQDGQNLFDAHTSFAGEWRVDETMLALAHEGFEAIIVGIPNNADRMAEYSPYADFRFGGHSGKGDAYLQFITQTLKPMIDHDFRTRPGRSATGIAGSSMGGLISLYAFLAYNHTFGFCAAMSPSYWFASGSIFKTIYDQHTISGRLHLDVGTDEGRRTAGTRNPYVEGMRRVRDALVQNGFVLADSLHYVEELHGEHNEAAWARRLPDALRFLLRR